MFHAKKITVGTVIIAVLFIAGMQIVSCRQNQTTEKSPENALPEINLGRFLFYDRRLSINNTRSCATCHNQQFAFTDGYKRSLGVFADLHQRNTEPIFNLDQLKYLTAADSTLHTPLQQMMNPLLNEHPAEMGVKGNEEKILARISADEKYRQMFKEAGKNINWDEIRKSISSFTESIQSYGSKYDSFKNGNSSALNENEKRGMELFFSEKLKCSPCHGGKNFSSPTAKDENGKIQSYFNTGLYNLNSEGSYPDYDHGLKNFTHNAKDEGKFRVPSLRNLAFTSPYFHDGSAASLREVIESYAAGGRKIDEGIYKGDGRSNPHKSSLISGFEISENDKINLISFLLSLSDSNLISNPAYANPFVADETVKKY